jgi:hypothetical protein
MNATELLVWMTLVALLALAVMATSDDDDYSI